MMKNLSLLCKFFREYFSMSGKALKGKLQENLFFKIQLKVSFKEIGFFSRLISFERFFKHSSREQNLSHKKLLKFKRKMNNASLGKNAKFYCGRLFFAKPAFLWFCRQYVISEKKFIDFAISCLSAPSRFSLVSSSA